MRAPVQVLMCMLLDQYQRRAPRWPLPLLAPLFLASLVACIGYTLERHHYTVTNCLCFTQV